MELWLAGSTVRHVAIGWRPRRRRRALGLWRWRLGHGRVRKPQYAGGAHQQERIVLGHGLELLKQFVALPAARRARIELHPCEARHAHQHHIRQAVGEQESVRRPALRRRMRAEVVKFHVERLRELGEAGAGAVEFRVEHERAARYGKFAATRARVHVAFVDERDIKPIRALLLREQAPTAGGDQVEARRDLALADAAVAKRHACIDAGLSLYARRKLEHAIRQAKRVAFAGVAIEKARTRPAGIERIRGEPGDAKRDRGQLRYRGYRAIQRYCAQFGLRLRRRLAFEFLGEAKGQQPHTEVVHDQRAFLRA